MVIGLTKDLNKLRELFNKVKRLKMMVIKNISKAWGKIESGESILQQWEKISERKAKVCSEKGCIETNLLGVLVQKNDANDDAWYIVPLCHLHSEVNGVIELITGTILVEISDILIGQ